MVIATLAAIARVALAIVVPLVLIIYAKDILSLLPVVSTFLRQMG